MNAPLIVHFARGLEFFSGAVHGLTAALTPRFRGHPG
jgi:hypothetical protein